MKGLVAKTLTIAFALGLITACHQPSTPPPPPPLHPAVKDSGKQPITQVMQTFNLPYEEAWAKVVSTLNNQGLRLKVSDINSGKIMSEWVELEDEPCGTYPRTHAKLPCRVRFSLEIQPLSYRASSFTASYYEECYDLKSLNLECAESNAEKKLLDLVDSLKRAVGAPL